MFNSTLATSRRAVPIASGGLRALLDRLQTASRGGIELDELLMQAFDAARDAPGGSGLPDRRAAWTTDSVAAHTMLPDDYNFSVGRRDGVCWAWTQPNDGWEPSEYEARHDHPGGSGLVVASTVALALTCAALILHIKRLDASA